MNKAIITGRLTGQPKIRHAGELKIANYSLAVDRRFKAEGQPTVDFINVVAFKQQADFAEKYLKKGMKIGVSGRIQTGSWKAQDGSTRYSFEIVAEEVEFLQKKSENEAESVTEHNEWQDAVQEELPFV